MRVFAPARLKIWCLLVCLGLLPIRYAWAFGLGQIQIASKLGEPLSAEIEFVSIEGISFDTVAVGLADGEAFQRAGIQRSENLLGLKFIVVSSDLGAKLLVSTVVPVDEPFLNFLVDVTWPAGRLQREFTVLLDPPVFSGENAALEARPVQTEAPFMPQPTATQTAAVPAGELYGPVLENQTLWSIAYEVRPDKSVSVYQSMLAILEANPHAFANGNVNMLKRGEILRIPSASTFKSMERGEAYREFVMQNKAWEGSRISQAQGAAKAPVSTSNAPEASRASASRLSANRPQLELLVPQAEESLSAAESSGEDGVTAAGGIDENDTSLAQEAIDTVKRENDELRSRILDLESQIKNMEALIQLRSEQLSDLDGQMTASPAAETDKLLEPTAVMDEAVEPESKPSLMDSIAQNRTVALVAALLALVLVALGVRVVRRRREEDVEDYVEFEEHHDPEPPLPNEDGSAVASHILDQVNELVEQDQQGVAQKLLRDHLEIHPDDHDARTRLIEIYYDAGNIHMFVSESERLHSLIVGTRYSGWERVCALGAEVAPEHWLFAETTDTLDLSAQVEDSELEIGRDSDEEPHLIDGFDEGLVAEHDELDIDSSPSLMASTQATASDAQADADMEAKAFAELKSLDDDDGFGLLELTDDEPAFRQEVLGDVDDLGGEDFSTQLDLATTYIEMEDYEGAEELLKEVITSGATEEKEEAQALMKKLKAAGA